MTRRKPFRTMLWFLTWLALLPWPLLVRAHSELVTADPGPGAQLATAPAEIRLTFSTPPASGSTFVVWGENFQQVPEIAPQIDPQRPNQLFAALPPLTAGDYTVQWTSVAGDGDKLSGSYAFRVLAAAKGADGLIRGWVVAVGAVALVLLIWTARRTKRYRGYMNHFGDKLLPKATLPVRDQTATYRIDKAICFCLHHWLALLLVPLLLFTTAPFLAPVAMAAGREDVGRAIYVIYSPFCHQLPQRSWFLFGEKLTYTLAEINQVFPYTDAGNLRRFVGTPAMGWKVAWSDRMISFYFMTPVWGLVYAILRRTGRAVRPLSLRVLLFALALLVIDGVAHIINDTIYGVAGGGFRDTNAWLAFLTANALPEFYAGDHFGTFNWWMRLLTGLLAAWGLAFGCLPWLDSFFRREAKRNCNLHDPL